MMWARKGSLPPGKLLALPWGAATRWRTTDLGQKIGFLDNCVHVACEWSDIPVFTY